MSTPYWWSSRLEELYDLASHVAGEQLAVVEGLIEVELCSTSTLHMAVKLSGGDPLTLEGGIFEAYPHIRLLCEKLDALERRELDHRNLMVTMPPQHGKSTTCSKHYPTRYLARRPEHRVLLASYEADKAAKWGRKTRDQINAHARWLGIEVSAITKAADRWELIGHEGGMQTAGIGGPLTGEGGEVIIIDDPVKNPEEAASEAIQERNWDWYTQVVHTRRQADTVKVLIQTRWNEADLAGRILEEEGDDWEVLNLPALAEDNDPLGRAPGEPLCPDKFDLDDLEKTRSLLKNAWHALYQQAPSPKEGTEFKKADFRYFEPAAPLADGGDGDYYRLVAEDRVDLVRIDDCFRYTTMDLADTLKKRSDWTVVAVWDLVPALDHDDESRKRPTRLCLLDVRRVKVEGDVHLPLLEQIDGRYAPRWHGVEKAYLGRQLVKRAIRSGLHMRGLEADRDKTARAETASNWVNNGRVFFRRGAGWLPTWEHELLIFPNGKHDDQVDVFAYACEEADRIRGLTIRRRQKTRRARMVGRHHKDRHPILGRT